MSDLNYESPEWREGYRAGMNDGIRKAHTFPDMKPDDEQPVTTRRTPGVKPWLADVYHNAKQRLGRLRA
jgi:hypothetical protein